LDFDNLTAVAIEKYNDWVGRTRAWCNLVLVQQKEVSRREACLPRYLKGYPGFPGSQRYATPETLPENLKKLEQAAREQSEKAAARFAKLSPEVWPNIQQRFSPATKTADGQKPRPRTANQTVCRRFAALRAAKPEMAPAQLAEEILAGIFRGTEKLKKHLVANGFEDRRAVIKLANLYNVATAFALEPIRVSGDYILFYAQETPKRNAFGDVRGGLHQPSDESAAIQITGFSVNEDGAPNYNGLLVCRKSAEENDDSWAFLYCHQGGQTFQLADQTAKLRCKSLTEWLGFASRGGSRKKAEASVKQLVRRRVWVSEKTPPSVLPLAFGSRQGREYLWHFDRDLRTKNEWVLGNGRLLRVIPPGRPKAAEFYLTITFERQAPPLADFKAEKFIGVDRGEAVPAAYAVVDKQGKHLASGKIAEVYREQQRQFNEAKRELQRTQGGYTRWLRSKERNRARALGGEVTRAMLALAAEHQAPLVLENLSSSLATRGGKRTMMSQMQYERMLTSLEQKLAEVGLYALPSAPRFRKGDNGYIKLVGPAYTSSTCSACGHVHSSEFYEKLADGLEADGNSIWRITLANGQKRVLPTEYTYWLKAKGEQTKQTHHRIAELLDGKAISKISKSNRNSLVRLLKGSWLPYRPKQAEFQCVVCGHQMNADIQGAINIARKFLFRLESNKKANEMTEAERRKVIGEWESWYKQKLAAVWHV
jgi:transposase